MPSLQEEYAEDDRRRMYQQVLSESLNQGPPLTPLAGALQGAQGLLAGILSRRLRGEYQDRASARQTALSTALQGLAPGAGSRDLADALARSGNPDLQDEASAMLMRSFATQRPATFSTTPYYTPEGGVVQLSSAGGAQPIEGLQLGPSPTSIMQAQLRQQAAEEGRQFSAEQQGRAQAFSAAQQARGISAADARAEAQRAAAEGRSQRYAEVIDRQTQAMKEKSIFTEDVKAFSAGEPIARAANTAITGIDKALGIMARSEAEGKPLVGPGSKFKLDVENFAQRARNLLGAAEGDPDKLDRKAATELLDRTLKGIGFAGAKEIFGTGAGFTQKDMEMALELVGTIDTNPAALKELLMGVRERNATIVDRHNATIDSVQAEVGRPVWEARRIKLRASPAGRPAPAPGAARAQAPPEAIEYLRMHPEAAEDFRAKFGYIP